MDTQNVIKTEEKTTDESNLILKEAEDIIKQNGSSYKLKKVAICIGIPTLILLILLAILSTVFAWFK